MYKDKGISDEICSIDGHNDRVLGYCLYHLCQKQSAFCTYCLTQLDTHQQHRKWCIPFKEIEKKILPEAINRFEQEEQDFQYLSKQLIACKDSIEKKFNYKQQKQKLVDKLSKILTKVQDEHQNMEEQENLCKQLLEEPSQQYYESLKNKIIKIKQIFRNEKNYVFQQISCLFKQKYDYNSLRIQMNQINILNKNLAQIYFNRGVSLGNKRQYRLAEAQFDQALLKDPQFAEAYVYKGYILHWRKDIMTAIQFYDQALQLDQRNICCFIAKGQTLAHKGQVEQSEICYEKAILLQNTLEEEDKCNQAIKYLNFINQRNPKYIDIFNFIANDLQKNKQYDKADQYYNFAQKLNQKYLQKNFCFGNDTNPIRNFQAQQYIEKGTYSFLKAQAQGLERLKQYEDAIKCLDEGINTNPYEVQFYFQKADLLQKLKQYPSAIKCLDEGIKMNPNKFQFYYDQAHRLKRLKKYDDAIKCYDDGIKANPNEIQFYIQKAQLLEMLKQGSNAVKCYDDGIKANPNEIQLYFEKAFIVKLEDNDNAVKCYDDGIKANPNEIQLYFEKAFIVKLEDNDNAVKCFDDGIKAFPNEVKLYLKKGLAELLNTLMQLDNEIKCYDDGIKANPNEVQLYLQKVDLLKIMDHSIKDLKCLDEGINMNPNKVQPCLQTAAPLNKEWQQNNATQYFDDSIIANYYDQFNIQNGNAFILKDLLVKQVKMILQCVDDGLKANPNHILFYFAKVDFLIEIGLYTIALQLFEHIIPPHNNVYFQLQKVYNLIKQGKYDDAFNCYKNEVKLNKNNYFFTAQQQLLRNHSTIVKITEIQYSENFEAAIKQHNEQHNGNFVLEQFEKRYQIQVQTLSEYSEKLERQKQYIEAIQILDQKMRMSKEMYFKDQEKKAQLLKNLKNNKEALICYRLVLSKTQSQEILNKKQLIIKEI